MQQDGEADMADAETPEVNPASRQSEKVYEPARVVRSEHAEGVITRLIEQQTAKVPSDLFLAAALGAFGLAVYYYRTGRRDLSGLIGLCAPTLLTMGVYNKLVKMLGPR